MTIYLGVAFWIIVIVCVILALFGGRQPAPNVPTLSPVYLTLALIACVILLGLGVFGPVHLSR